MENSLDQEAQEMKEKKSMYCPEKSKNLFLNILSFSAATVKIENEVIWRMTIVKKGTNK